MTVLMPLQRESVIYETVLLYFFPKGVHEIIIIEVGFPVKINSDKLL